MAEDVDGDGVAVADQQLPSTAVRMRLFANWEQHRIAADVVQRIVSFSLSRLVLHSVDMKQPWTTLCVTTKLQNSRRSLRSADFAVRLAGLRVDVSLNIEFTIHYSHVSKVNGNLIRFFLQRRRRYKNRPIPGGFKTVAVAVLDLSRVLNEGFDAVREIPLFSLDQIKKKVQLETAESIGHLCMTTFESIALPDIKNGVVNVGFGNEAAGPSLEMSSDSEGEVENLDQGGAALASSNNSSNRPPAYRLAAAAGRGASAAAAAAIARRKNIKKKLALFMRNLKNKQDLGDEVSTVVSARSSGGRIPSAQELERLFDEIDQMSDLSGADTETADRASIRSQPRPRLGLYFDSSNNSSATIHSNHEQYEYISEESEDGDDWSSDGGDAPQNVDSIEHQASTAQPSSATAVPVVPHSSTRDSIAYLTPSSSAIPKPEPHCRSLNKMLSIGEQMAANSNSSSDTLGVWWLAGAEANVANALTSCSNRLKIVQAINTAHARQIASTFLQRIPNMNNGAANVNVLAIIGGDRTINAVLRTYVELQARGGGGAGGLLRFGLVAPPWSLTGRLVASLDPQLDAMAHSLWEESSSPDQLVEMMLAWATAARSAASLAIAEALLQMTDPVTNEVSRVFVPFLAEVRVGGGGGEDDEATTTASSTAGSPSPRIQQQASASLQITSREGDENAIAQQQQQQQQHEPSPPATPYTPRERSDMCVEYWLGERAVEPSSSSTTSTSVSQSTPTTSGSSTPARKEKDGHGLIKTTFRTLLVSRAYAQPLLSLSFVKERRRAPQMFQKFGMKQRPRASTDGDAGTPVLVTNVARLLCSTTAKHADLTVWIDGQVFHGVRFFQTSSQWQTHVKFLPIAVTPPP